MLIFIFQPLNQDSRLVLSLPPPPAVLTPSRRDLWLRPWVRVQYFYCMLSLEYGISLSKLYLLFKIKSL